MTESICEWKIIGCEGAAAVHSPPCYWKLRLHLSLAQLAQLRTHALRPPRLRRMHMQKGIRERTILKFHQMTGIKKISRSRACKCGWAGRGNAQCEGQEWCHKGCTTRTALLHSVGLLGRDAQGRREIHCKAAFWRRPPLFSGHFRAQRGWGGVAFLCRLSGVRAPLRSRRCSKHHRPPQILPCLSELLQQAISHPVAARRHACAEAMTRIHEPDSHSRSSCSDPNLLLRTILAWACGSCEASYNQITLGNPA